MTVLEVDRLKQRLLLCQSEIRQAKANLSFWSKELAFCVDQLATDKQFNFNEFLTKEDFQ